MKNNTKGFVAVLVVLVIGVVTLGSALFLTSWIRDRIPETEEEKIYTMKISTSALPTEEAAGGHILNVPVAM